LIASLVSLKFGAIQIALVHLFFNIFGVLLWFPIPVMRRIPLAASRILGIYASFFKWFPPVYILSAFLITPGILLGASEAVKANIAGGVIFIFILLVWIGLFGFAWLKGFKMGASPTLDGTPLCYKVLSKEKREEATRDLAAANEAVVALA
jgi:sodium-dependent phosphate cotransporter